MCASRARLIVRTFHRRLLGRERLLHLPVRLAQACKGAPSRERSSLVLALGQCGLQGLSDELVLPAVRHLCIHRHTDILPLLYLNGLLATQSATLLVSIGLRR